MNDAAFAEMDRIVARITNLRNSFPEYAGSPAFGWDLIWDRNTAAHLAKCDPKSWIQCYFAYLKTEIPHRL